MCICIIKPLYLDFCHQQRVFYHTQQKSSLGETKRRNKVFFTTYRQKNKSKPLKKNLSMCVWHALMPRAVFMLKVSGAQPLQCKKQMPGSKALYYRMDNDGFDGLPNRLDRRQAFHVGGMSPIPSTGIVGIQSLKLTARPWTYAFPKLVFQPHIFRGDMIAIGSVDWNRNRPLALW